jgi:hypothetical protein
MDRARREALRAAVIRGGEKELLAFSMAVFERCMATAEESGGTWTIALNELIPGRVPSQCVLFIGYCAKMHRRTIVGRIAPRITEEFGLDAELRQGNVLHLVLPPEEVVAPAPPPLPLPPPPPTTTTPEPAEQLPPHPPTEEGLHFNECMAEEEDPLDAVIGRHWPGKSLTDYPGPRDGLNPHWHAFLEYITGGITVNALLPPSAFDWADSALAYRKDLKWYLTPLGLKRIVPLLKRRFDADARLEGTSPSVAPPPPAHQQAVGALLRHVSLPWLSARPDKSPTPASIDPHPRLEGTKITLRTSGSSSTVTPIRSHLEQALQAADPCNDNPKKACLTTGCRRPAEDGKDMCTPCIAALQLETDSLDGSALATPSRRTPASPVLPLQPAVPPKKGCITTGCRRLAEDGKDMCTQCATELQNDSDSLSGSTPVPSRTRSGAGAGTTTSYRNKVWRIELTLYSKERAEHRCVDWPFLVHIPVEEIVPSEVRCQFSDYYGALFVSVISKSRDWLSEPIYVPAFWVDKPRTDEVTTKIWRYDASKLAQASSATVLKGRPCDMWRVDLELASTGETIPLPQTFKCPYVVEPGDFTFVLQKGMIEGTCSIELKNYEWLCSKFLLPEGITTAAQVKRAIFTRLTPSKFLPVDDNEVEEKDGTCPYLDSRGKPCTVVLANPAALGCVRHMCVGCRQVIAENGSTRCAACVGTLRGIQRRATLPMARHVIELLSQKIKDDGKEWSRFLAAKPGADKEPYTDNHPTSPAFTRKGVLLALEFYNADLTLFGKIFPADDPAGERREKPLKRRRPDGEEEEEEEGEPKAKKAKPMA